MGETKTLFQALARHQPERCAQAMLCHALETDVDFARAFANHVGEEGVVVELREEEIHGSWRADLVVTWSTGGRTRVELKLGAPFTAGQLSAAHKRQIDLVVAPSFRAIPDDMKRVAWKDLADWTNSPTLTSLLRDVAAFGGWTRELKVARAAQEMESYALGGRDASWRCIYLFLSTVDALLDRTNCTSGAWSHSRSGEWYGFLLQLHTSGRGAVYWLGFERIDTGVELVLWRSPDGRREVIDADAGRYDSSVVAHAVSEKLDKWASEEPAKPLAPNEGQLG